MNSIYAFYRYILGAALLLAVLVSVAPSALAGSDKAGLVTPAEAATDSPRLPAPIYNEFTYLLDLMKNKSASLEPDKIKNLLDFSQMPKKDPKAFTVDKRDGATGAFYEYTIKAPATRVIDYLYNSALPQYMFIPSAIRLNAWVGKTDPDEPIPSLWKRLDNEPDGRAFLVRGTEYEENTPDPSTGGYFHYELDRLLVLLKQDGHKYLISLTKQKKPSSIGKKGAIIGDDRDWNYFYSGKDGLNVTGLSWADSYIYDAMSVMIYQEPEPGKPATKVSILKWIRAGWSRINMTQPHHLVDGMHRLELSVREILESPRLPSPERLAPMIGKINGLSDAELAEQLKPYARAIERVAPTDPVLSGSDFAKVIQNGAFLDKQSREEKVSLLLREQVKSLIGKQSLTGPVSADAQTGSGSAGM